MQILLRFLVVGGFRLNGVVESVRVVGVHPVVVFHSGLQGVARLSVAKISLVDLTVSFVSP